MITDDDEKILLENQQPATMGHLVVSMKALQDQLKAVSKRTADMGAQIDRVTLMGAKIHELEQQQIKFCGYWSEGESYSKNDAVTFAGNLFICRQPTKGRPASDTKGWTMAVKGGRG